MEIGTCLLAVASAQAGKLFCHEYATSQQYMTDGSVV
jgi:hypothetical protein